MPIPKALPSTRPITHLLNAKSHPHPQKPSPCPSSIPIRKAHLQTLTLTPSHITRHVFLHAPCKNHIQVSFYRSLLYASIDVSDIL